MVAVGDTNEVFLFSVSAGSGQYNLTHVFNGSNDASFSTDWSPNGQQFAVASQDGVVSVFDVRSLPPADDHLATDSGAGVGRRPPNRVAEIRSLQPRGAGAARKVKFSPSSAGGTPLLAFTEVSPRLQLLSGPSRKLATVRADSCGCRHVQHRSLLHVVDARTFESMQTVDVPAVFAKTSAAFPYQEWDEQTDGRAGLAAFGRSGQPGAPRPPRWAYYRPSSGVGVDLLGGAYQPNIPTFLMPGRGPDGQPETWERARAAASEYVRVSSEGWSAPNGRRVEGPSPSDTLRMEVQMARDGGGGGGEGSGIGWGAGTGRRRCG